jgi:hypothetical protein
MPVIQDMSGNSMITCSNPEWNLFTILNAERRKAALLSEDYQTLDQRELRSLGEIIACQQLIPVPFSELAF